MRTIVLFPVLFFLPFVKCLAAPVYGPELPKRGQWHMGFQGNFVLRKDMHKGLNEVLSRQYFYNASYGLYDWLSFDGKLGVGDFEFTAEIPGNLNFEIGFSGGYGLRAKVYDDKINALKGIIGFHHISIHPPSESIGDVKYSAVYDEWEISFFASKKFGLIEPYIGGKVSQVFIIRRDNLEDDWSWNGSKEHIGFIIGSNFNISDRWYINVESRFLDEGAVSVAVSFKD